MQQFRRLLQTLCLQAQLLHVGNGSLADFAVESNSTRAIAGRAVFSGLSVSAQPGTRYKLRFTTQSGIAVDRDLLLRQCWAGAGMQKQRGAVTLIQRCYIDCYSVAFRWIANVQSCISMQCIARSTSPWFHVRCPCLSVAAELQPAGHHQPAIFCAAPTHPPTPYPSCSRLPVALAADSAR